ncbi:MAG: hypothetical protein IPG05_00540 [Gemmatimonadetes bacterium]|nr:hypothetical protein [Gemmatimonadota bacterium]
MSVIVTLALVLTILIGTIISAVVIQQRRLLRAHSSFAGRLIAAQDRDRARIARELHDELVMRLNTATHTLRLQNGRITETQALEMDQIAEDIRLVARDLHPTAVDYQGLEPAMRTMIETKARTHAVTIDASFSGSFADLDGRRRLTIYRVAQEALANAIHHSGGTEFSLTLTAHPGGVRLVVRDTGKGFDLGTVTTRHGLGLTSMEERVKLLDGQIEIVSSRGHGTEVRVEIPVPSTVSS